MADLGVFTKNADIQARAGIYANATSKAVTATDVYVLAVESLVNAQTKFDWSAWYAGAGAASVYKGLCTEAGACLCAVYVIESDMSVFTTVAEAQSMIITLNNRAEKAMNALVDANVKTLMGAM